MNKTVFFAVLLLTFLSVNKLLAQSNVKKDSTVKRKQSFVLYAGGGASQYTSSINPTPGILQGNVTKTSVAGTIRLMWHPGYRLNLGIETGFVNFYSYKVKNGNIAGKVSVSAIPILIVWSMPIVKRVAIFAGLGSYLLTTNLNYDGVVKSTANVLGLNIALAYTLPISKNVGIVAEAKWMNAFVTKDEVVSLQAMLAWKFFR